MNKRHVLYLDESMVDETGEFVPTIVTEGEAGHSPTTYRYGNDFAAAKRFVEEANAARGIDKDTALQIVADSMARSFGRR